jgi:hypothetical protein
MYLIDNYPNKEKPEMKSTIEKPVPQRTINYPCFMIHNGENNDDAAKDLVVLFISERDGICVHSARSGHPVGLRLTSWTSAVKDCWEPFYGKITIEV